MKRVLVITYYWPPAGGAGVQRWVKFVRYLRGYGWEPVIYTPSNPERGLTDSSLAEELPAGLEVLTTRIREPYEIYRRLTRGASTQITDLTAAGPGGGQSLKKKLSLAIRGNFFVPDPRCAWVRPSVKFLSRYLREHPVDAVVTTGPPHSLHLIGRGLRRRCGLPWVADFRDPWTRMFYFGSLHLLPWVKRKHQRLEQSVLDEASAVISVSSQVREDFLRRTGTPVELITNGYDETDFQTPPPPRDREHWTIVHTGNIGSDGNPRRVWEVLGKMVRENDEVRRKLRLRLCGKLDAGVVATISDAGLSENVVLLGYLSHEDTVREQRGADLLLLPLRQGEEGGKVVPGKTFEYLASRRRVLGIGNPEGAAASILSSTRGGKMLGWEDAEGMLAELRQSWEDYLEGKFVQDSINVEQYSRRALAGHLAKLLDSVI